MIDFFIPHIARPKQGDRVRVVAPKKGKPFAAHYTPKDVKENAAVLAALMRPFVPAKPLEGPLSLALVFVFSWRKSESKKNIAMGSRWKDTKPDCDNLQKNICDVMERMGFYVNDSQLADVHVRKLWADSPGVDVSLRELAT